MVDSLSRRDIRTSRWSEGRTDPPLGTVPASLPVALSPAIAGASETNSLKVPATIPLFGTDGIRGRVGDLLTAPLALQVGFWTGQVLHRKSPDTLGPVIIGQDSRTSGDMLAAALAAGLTAAGLDTWFVGLCPTPAVAHLCRSTGASGGIMVSASHNPPGDNGIKIFGADGTKLSNHLQQEIEQGLRGELFSRSAVSWGRCQHRLDLLQGYSDALLTSLPGSSSAPSLSGLRIVLDLAWGAAAHLGPQIFRSLGAEVICLNAEPDGTRINLDCGSTHLQALQQAVVAQGADLGFAFDGDADRVLAVDCQGRAVDGDYILYLWGQHLQALQQLPNDTIVATVMANLGFERAWQRLGGEFVRTPVGDQHVFAEMVQRGAMLGGEQSGHVLCFHYGVSGDGLLTAVHLAALVQQAGVSLAELVDASFQPYPQILRNVRVEDRHTRMTWANNDRLQAAIAQAESDLGDQGRILVRASGTEPLVRVMVEAATETLTQHWSEYLSAVVSAELG
ncbi:phosphoglucosamine mutase [Leptolyngbya sp. FACHB-261]|uniref:phosphoglucosamine mutase n=1 Tax=Leptolyngbya sp. FACHB-261 TaxID=2692806 RepID=UPI0016842AED|nr:phosphoglucosamine mutase [Leptolyngbya sp. FACHB-261]MBD2104077.1 phosphoglucosamine mutase [Leptolyngbya sp. FACHB-261]